MDRLNDNSYKTYVKNIIVELIDFVLKIPASAKPKHIIDTLIWVKDYLSLKINSFTFDYENIPDLTRGQIVLVELGDNFGLEFSGKHYAILLRNCRKGIDQVFVLPITSKKPKTYTKDRKGIYVEIPRIPGFKGYENPLNPQDPDNDKHWANILSVRNISKQRMIYPSVSHTISGTVLDEISGAIVSQIALR